MVDDLVNYVAGKRDTTYSYIPNDVGLVQTMMSAQTMMFQLATFYTKYKSGTALTRYEGGLGKWICFKIFFIVKNIIYGYLKGRRNFFCETNQHLVFAKFIQNMKYESLNILKKNLKSDTTKGIKS